MTRPMSEYFANDPECHDLLPCALRSHRVARFGGGCPTGPPVGGVTSTSTPALWPCAVLWPCTFCSDRGRPHNGAVVSMRVFHGPLTQTVTQRLAGIPALSSINLHQNQLHMSCTDRQLRIGYTAPLKVQTSRSVSVICNCSQGGAT